MKNRAVVIVIAALTLLSGAALAQGQRAAFEQAMQAYQALLQDPNLDPGTRNQVMMMIQQLQRQAGNMSSLSPSVPREPDYRAQYEQQQQRQQQLQRQQQERQQEEDNRPSRCGDADHCDQSAQ